LAWCPYFFVIEKGKFILFIEDGRRLLVAVSGVIGFREPATPRRLFPVKEMQDIREVAFCTRVAVLCPNRKNINNKQLATAPVH
jgi:hypothetical protein